MDAVDAASNMMRSHVVRHLIASALALPASRPAVSARRTTRGLGGGEEEEVDMYLERDGVRDR